MQAPCNYDTLLAIIADANERRSGKQSISLVSSLKVTQAIMNSYTRETSSYRDMAL